MSALIRFLRGDTMRTGHTRAPARGAPCEVAEQNTINRIRRCRRGTFAYNVNDQYIGRALHEYGEFSEGEVAMFERFVRPGQTVVDAGANMGAHTVVFCNLVGPAGRVHAFEPQRVIHQLLCANLALNSLLNGHVYQAALSDIRGQITVDVPDYSKANNFGGMALGGWREGECVPMTTIDDLRLEACDFMKIDVEGMECAVLRGSQRTLSRFRPVLYVENDRAAQAHQLVAQLQALGYDLFWHRPAYFNPDNFDGNPVNIFGDIVSRNMLCLPRERARQNPGLVLVTEETLPSAADIARERGDDANIAGVSGSPTA